MTARLLRLLGILMMLSSAALLLSRAPDRAVETLVARWGLPPSTFVEVGSQFVHLRDVGPRSDPLPIVLVHGSADSLHAWDAWVRALQGRRRIVSFDLPGFGLSGPRADGDYHGDADARFVLALLDSLQLSRCVLVGHSLGGEVAWRTASLAPSRVQRLVLIDATGLPGNAGSVPLAWRLARVPVLNRLLEWVLPRPLVVQGLVQVYADPQRITDELVDRFFELALREGNRRALVERLRQRVDGADSARLDRLTQPTLILWGAEDRLLPPATAREFRRRIAGSELVVLDGLGHAPHEEDPTRALAPVTAFLGID